MSDIERTQYDISLVAIGDNKFDDITLSALGAVTYVEGTVLAFDKTTNKYVATSTNVPEAGNAKAVLMGNVEFSGAGDKLVRGLLEGEVDEDKLTLVFGSDTLDTIPGGADDSFRVQLRDYGILVVKLQEGTFENNS
jgi:hypothetical protein